MTDDDEVFVPYPVETVVGDQWRSRGVERVQARLESLRRRAVRRPLTDAEIDEASLAERTLADLSAMAPTGPLRPASIVKPLDGGAANGSLAPRENRALPRPEPDTDDTDAADERQEGARP